MSDRRNESVNSCHGKSRVNGVSVVWRFDTLKSKETSLLTTSRAYPLLLSTTHEHDKILQTYPLLVLSTVFAIYFSLFAAR
jgi:hypothetical protein